MGADDPTIVVMLAIALWGVRQAFDGVAQPDRVRRAVLVAGGLIVALVAGIVIYEIGAIQLARA